MRPRSKRRRDEPAAVAAEIGLHAASSRRPPASSEPPQRSPAPPDPALIAEEAAMARNVDESLQDAMAITGAIGAALVDYTSGMTLGVAGGGPIDLEIAAACNTDLLRAQMNVMQQLNVTGGIEDILITLDDQLHLIRLVDSARGEGLFLYLALNRGTANLAMARHQLRIVEKALTV
jgi:hypothetical protein